MSRRRRQVLSPSLFPFLAVLVCTLGTLILFLALVAQNATKAAERNAEAERIAKANLQAVEAEPTIPRLTSAVVESMLDEERFRVTQLVAFRDKQTADLEDRRDQLTYLEDQQQRLRHELRRLSDEVEQAMGDAEIETVDDETITRTRQLLDTQRSLVEKLRSESADKTPRVVIVPHKGPNGTDRRPVYLECTAQGLTIWPEGSHITMTQLEDANFSANPLDAALRAVRLHTMKHYGDTTPPYPLLVVRPDGIETYAAARGAMQDWDDQFGYELVPANVKLAFSQPDTNLKQRVDLAIREAAAKQHAQNAIASRAVGRGGSYSGSGDRRGGGEYRSGRLPTLSAASLDRAGRAGGYRSHRDYAQNQRSPYTSGSEYTAGSQYDSSSGRQSQYNNLNGNSYPTDDAGAAARKWAAEMQTAAQEMRDTQAGDQAGIGGAGFGEANVGASGRAEGSLSDPPGERAIRSGPSYSQLNQHAAQAGSGESTDIDPSDSQAANRNSPDGSSSLNSGTSTASSGLPPQSSSASGPAPGGPQASGSSSPTMNMPQTGSAAASNQTASGAPLQASANAAANSQLVRREGRDWALPPNMGGMGGNTIVRTIRVQCSQDRFLLLPSASGGSSETFEFSSINSGDIEQATLRLATAVRDRVALWGPALTGGRWQPRLDVIVMPNGETRFHQLRTLMIDSGVEVAGRASQ